jgi:ATP-binding cassette subfamily F protein 3
MRGKTVFEECLSVFDELRGMETEAEELTGKLSDLPPASAEYAEVAARYSHIMDVLQTHDIYTLDSQVGTVLGGLGFSKDDWERRTEEFSGGWQMRIALAKLLLEKPSLLLLDEPTNHLDLETRNWLEDYLRNYENAFVLISHDRYFLDVTVGKIMEVWNKRAHVYHGGFEKYVVQKEERKTQLLNAYKNQPLPLPGDEGEAGAVADQGARKDRADCGAGGRGDDPLHDSAAAGFGADGDRGVAP